MRIVVPTDFSEYAKGAILFATAFAKQVQAELMLLHVLPNIGPTLGTSPTSHLKEEMLQWAEKEFKLLADGINADDLIVTHQIAFGASVEMVIDPFIKTHAIDLIIMGPQYVSKSSGELLAMFTHNCGFLEQLFHKNITREIIWHNKIPLLVLNKQ